MKEHEKPLIDFSGVQAMTYDDTQIGAKLITCAGCGKVSYNTNHDPKCAKCRTPVKQVSSNR
jgi:ribosomal protein L37E